MNEQTLLNTAKFFAQCEAIGLAAKRIRERKLPLNAESWLIVGGNTFVAYWTHGDSFSTEVVGNEPCHGCHVNALGDVKEGTPRRHSQD